MVATYDDANLLIQTMRWGTEMGLDDAMAAIFDEGFDPETAPMDNPSVRIVLSYGETVGALVKNDVLNRDLLLDIFWADGIWPRVSRHALAAREQAGDARLYEHFEALVANSGSK
jgi:hypothetical protein